MKWPLLHLVKGYRVATSPIWVIEYSSPFSFFEPFFDRVKNTRCRMEKTCYIEIVQIPVWLLISLSRMSLAYTSWIALFSFSETFRTWEAKGRQAGRQAGRQGLRNMLHMCQEMGGAQPCGEKSIVKRRRDISKG